MSERLEPVRKVKSAVNSTKTESVLGVSQFQDNRPEASSLMQLQTMANGSQQVQHTTQLQATANQSVQTTVVQPKKNNTGLPDNLKSGIENLSGMSMDDVKVHRNSDKPAQLNAHAYAQGSEIHLASGQEKHLPHEAWHVVQQKQGRVKPTMQMKGNPSTALKAGVNVNDDAGLEKEADVMGGKAMAMSPENFEGSEVIQNKNDVNSNNDGAIQLAGDKVAFDKEESDDKETIRLQVIIKETIDKHKQSKKKYKDTIENEKDEGISKVPKVKIPDKADKTEREELLEQEKEPKRKILKTFVKKYDKSGWQVKLLKNEIKASTKALVKFGSKKGDEIPIIMIKGNKKIYTIFFGDKRFTAKPVDLSDKSLKNAVSIKKGTNKEYVQDARNVFIPRFASRGCSLDQLGSLFRIGSLKPRNPKDTIGKAQHNKYDFGERGPKDKMTQREKEFVQLRDGSGPDQRFLSITHAKASRKIFGNHGDVFTSEAVVKIDLAKIPKGMIFNQHMDVSRKGMIGLKNKERDYSSVQKEYETAVYSVIKNRETLLFELPSSAIMSVDVTGEKTMTPYQARRRYDRSFEFQELEKEKKEREEKLMQQRKLAQKLKSKKERLEKEKVQSEKREQSGEEAKKLTKLVNVYIKKMKGGLKKKAGLTKEVEEYFETELESLIDFAAEQEDLSLTDKPDIAMIKVLVKYATDEM